MRPLVLLLVLVLLASACASVASPTGDVLTYRGDASRTGVMTGPGPAREPVITWQAQFAGPIPASPVIADGLVYVVSGDGVVHALTLDGGLERWSVDLGAVVGGATPLIVGEALIVGDTAGRLTAFGRHDGSRLWGAELGGAIVGAPALGGDRIISATTSAFAYAIDPTNGQIAWQSRLPAGVTRSVAVTGETVYLGLSGGYLVALRLNDGELLWQVKISDTGEVGTPTAAAGLVLAATGISSIDGESKSVVAVDEASQAIRWRYASPERAQVYTPAVLDGLAHVVGKDGRVAALELGSGRERWSVSTNELITALPAIAGDVLYVASDEGGLMAFDRPTGKQLWRAGLIAGQAYAPVLSDGYMLVGTSQGVLYTLGEEARK